jgi:hypothetical protein
MCDKGPMIRWHLPVPRGFATPNSAAICRCSPERRRASLSWSGRLRISSRICHLQPLILEPAVQAAEASKALDVCEFLTSARSFVTGVLLSKTSPHRPRPLFSSVFEPPHADRTAAAIDLSPDPPKLRALRGVCRGSDLNRFEPTPRRGPPVAILATVDVESHGLLSSSVARGTGP